MAWTIACFCGHTWQGEPPDACPRCGVTIRAPQPPQPSFAEWLAHVRDEIGDHTTTTEDGMAW